MTRDELVSALDQRIRGFHETNDANLVLGEPAVSQVQQLAELVDAASAAGGQVDVRACVVLGWLHYCRFYALPEAESQPDWNAALRYFSAIAQVAPDSIPGSIRWYFTSASDVHSPGDATDRAIELMGQFQQTRDLGALDTAVTLLGVAAQATPAEDPGHAGTQANLARALWTRFEQTGQDGDLDATITARHRAVGTVAPDDPVRAGWLSDLGLALRVRFERSGQQGDLDAALTAGQQAVDTASASDPGRPAYLTNLGAALQTRYGLTGRPSDLDAAITVCQQALDVAPADHPGRATMLSNLGNALGLRFERSGRDDDLEAAITAQQHSVDATPPGDPARPMFLSNLAIVLGRRFERTGRTDDLDAAITALQQALDAVPADYRDRAALLSNLGTLVRRRFERAGQLSDLDAAIAALQQAVDATGPDNPTRPAYLSNLGAVLQARSERTGRTDDLEAAITACRQAVAATPDGHPARADRLTSLANALTSAFERTARAEDLEAAIAAGRMAVAASPAGHPGRAMYLSNLGTALFTWYQRAGQADDLDAAIAALQQAVDITQAGDPARALYLNNLGGALSRRFEQTGQAGDLDAAIAALQQGVDATPPDHPARLMYLSNAGLALMRRSDWAAQPSDLVAAIVAQLQAVAASPADDPARAIALSNLGNTLLTLSGQADGDTDAAISVLQQAVETTPADHPARAGRLSNLGNALQSRFGQTGQHSDLSAAIGCWRAAAESETAAPATRIAAARAWGQGQFADGDFLSAADAYAVGVHLLPQLAWHGLDRATQEEHLAAWAGMAADAAACAVLADKPRSAVEMLEQGRSVLWTQALHLRSDLARLREKAPDLAGRLDEVRGELNRPVRDDRPAVLAAAPGDGGVTAPEQAAANRRSLARQWDALVAQVRSLDGFERFLMPVPFDELRAAATEGPVVIVNTSPMGCHALVISSAGDPGVRAVALPSLSHQETLNQANTLLSVLSRVNDTGRPFLDREADRHAAFDVLEWLWRTIAAPVLDDLGCTAAMADGPPPPRVWWCPTGPLTVLPLHAAGRYSRTANVPTRPEDTVPGRVVSSYTPTLTALRRARETPPADPGSMRQLVVGMPSTPGLNPLPAVTAETQVLAGYFRPPQQACHLLAEQATRAAVLSLLPDYPWVHLACHAFQNQVQPAASAFALWDGPMTIADLTTLRLNGPELAFLSSCQTAEGAVRLLDEAIHLAAAMQLLGYRHVIATMWTIADSPAPEVARNVYARLTTAGQVQAAQALHRAARALYDSDPASPLLWAPYVHIGP